MNISHLANFSSVTPLRQPNLSDMFIGNILVDYYVITIPLVNIPTKAFNSNELKNNKSQ